MGAGADIVAAAPARGPRPSDAARRRMEDEGGAFWLCGWERVLMIHYAVEPAALRPLVPFPLDLYDGEAYVSLVAFTLRGLRPRGGGRLAAWLCAPLTRQRYLNVRTYVRCGGESGICFLAEWMDHRPSVWLVPRLYGLPYRCGRLDFRHDHERGELRGRVTGPDAPGAWTYRAAIHPEARYGPVAEGSLDEFLMERYAAYTERRGVRRRFRIWHAPWRQAEADAEVADDRLLGATGTWPARARRVGANYSPGCPEVWMGPPRNMEGGRRAPYRRAQRRCSCRNSKVSRSA